MPKLAVMEPAARRSALAQLINDYLADCSANPKIRPRTVDHYRDALAGSAENTLLSWAEREGITEPAQLDRKALDRRTAYLRGEYLTRAGKPLSLASVNSNERVVNQLLNWSRKQQADEGADYGVGKANARLQRLERKLLDVLSREELTRLEEAAQTERDRLIIRTLGETGMRLGELIRLRVDDLTEQGRNWFLLVHGSKGTGERLVPLAPKLAMRLRRYIDRTRPKDGGSDRLFVGLRRSRRTGDYEPLWPRSIQEMISDCARTSGIKKRVYPHLLRHSFVTWGLRRGMNPIQLARIVGHQDLGMINAVYAHLNMDDAAEALMKALRADED